MSFDVFFIDLCPAGPAAAARAQVEEAVRSAGGRLRRMGGRAPGDVVEAEGGSEFEWYGPKLQNQNYKGGGMAALRALDLPVCRCLFAIAARTDWVIIATMEDSRTIRTKGSRELPLHEGMPTVIEIESPEELCKFLSGGMDAWRNYRDQVVGQPREDVGARDNSRK